MAMPLGGNGQRAPINMTPMIDVLLVLIIIFMVITPPLPTGLPTLVPQAAPADAAGTPAAHEIVIFVRGERQLEFRRIAEVIDIARGAGVNRMAFMMN